jgi:hypothetical protein
MFYISYRYYKFGGIAIREINKTILIKFKKIIINDFELPDYFHKMNKHDKKFFLLNISNKFQYTHSKRHIHLINLINEFRLKNNLQRLLYNEEEKLPDFAIKESSEVIIIGFKNLFQLSNRKYLFRFKIGGFKTNFDKRDVEIIDVVLNKYINKISIIDIGKFEYLLFSDSFDEDYRVNLIESGNSLMNNIDTVMYDEKIEDVYYED